MNAWFGQIYDDDRLNPSHVSIYLALFQYWNLSRFEAEFIVARTGVMRLAKVNSKSTYSKCLKELQTWKYIKYYPSNNPFKGSRFDLTNNWTTSRLPLVSTSPISGPPLVESGPNNGLPLVPYKTYKQNSINSKRLTPSLNEVNKYFKEKNAEMKDAEIFWNYYEANGWLQGGKNPIIDWKAAAQKWLLSSIDKKQNQLVQKSNYLSTNLNKSYNEPL